MEQYAGKRLLILGGPTQCEYLVSTANAMGVHTIVTDVNPLAPAKKVAAESLPYGLRDYDSILKWCRENAVDGILNYCVDPAQLTYQSLCEELGFPCFGNKTQFGYLTDKAAFKALCRQCGLDTIPAYSLEDVRSGKAEYPVFVKPVDSSGSRGQSICYTLEETEAAVRKAKEESATEQYIIEKCMIGMQDFSMTYLVCDGEPVLFRTADRHLGDVKDGMNRETVASISPSAYTPMFLQYVDGRVKNMLRTIGLKNTPVLIQGFVGEKTIYLYDQGMRFPGNDYPVIFEKATGINLARILVEFALGGSIGHYREILEGSYLLCGKRLIQIMYNIAPGKIASIEGVDAVRDSGDILCLQEKHAVGDVIPATGDIKQRGCEVCSLVEDTAEAVKRVIDLIQEHLAYRAEDGSDMHISAIDSARMSALYRK